MRRDHGKPRNNTHFRTLAVSVFILAGLQLRFVDWPFSVLFLPIFCLRRFFQIEHGRLDAQSSHLQGSDFDRSPILPASLFSIFAHYFADSYMLI
jgi:hypothetical protein